MSDLELLRDIFKDTRLHFGVGVITQFAVAADLSILRVQVKLLPEGREIVAQMNFPDINDVTFPEVEDMVTVAFADGVPDDAFVVGIYNSADEPLPSLSLTGDSVKYSRDGHKLFLGSDTKVSIAKPGIEAAQALVLGNVLVTYLEALSGRVETLIDKLTADPVVICSAPGSPGLIHPTLAVDIAAIKTGLESDKSTYLTTSSSNILSQIGFTDRGT